MAVLTKCNSFSDADAILGNRNRKKIGHNTYLQRDGEVIEAIYHSTPIVTYFRSGRMRLETGGWYTPTTKDRLNQLTPLYITQAKNIWYLSDGSRFFDGIMTDDSGNVLNPQTSEHQDKIDAQNKAMKKAIKSYITKYLDELVVHGMPMPSNGDCWYCLGLLDDSSHLLAHMEESYFVPMLAVNALREAGYRDEGISIFLDMHFEDSRMGGRSTEYGTRVSVDTVKRAMRKYMQKRLLKRY